MVIIVSLKRRFVKWQLKMSAVSSQVDFLTIDGYDYAGTWDKQTNEASSLYDSAEGPMYAAARDIDATVQAYRKAGVPAAKYTMGLPLYAVGWTGVPNINHGLYQNATAASPVLLASGSGLCPNPSQTATSPGCDTLLTAGFLTYSTIENLNKNGYTVWYDSARVEGAISHSGALLAISR
ncbi:MAG: glycosyl hydrolase family 18 protein [Candidatus Sulfotelmatobacter sp.]|jgi:chitinase